MDEEEAKQGLREGRLYAVLQVPDGFVQDIMTGVNTPVTVIFPEMRESRAGFSGTDGCRRRHIGSQSGGDLQRRSAFKTVWSDGENSPV